MFANADPITKFFGFIIVGLAGIVACLVGFLILVTIWDGITGTDDRVTAEASSSSTPTTNAEEDEAIGSVVYGCQDGWQEKGYYSYEDCTKGKKFGQ